MRRILLALLLALGACAEGDVAGPGETPVPKDTTPSLPPSESLIYKYALHTMQSTTSASVIANFDSAIAAVALAYQREGRFYGSVISIDAYNRARSKAGWAAFLYSEGLLVGHFVGDRPMTNHPFVAALEDGEVIDLIYTNGIKTSTDVAAAALAELQALVSEMGLPYTVRLILNYNPSSSYVNSANMCLYTNLEIGDAESVSKCPGVPNDILEATRQAANLYGVPGISIEPISARLADFIRSERAKGIKVVLAGHSQGALIDAQALRTFNKYDPCVASLALGAPNGRVSFGLWGSDPGLVVKDVHSSDVITALGLNDFTTIETSLSRAAWTEKQKYFQLAVSYASTLIWMQDVKLHSFLESYMATTESREWIKSRLLEIFTRMNKYPNCTGAVGDRLYAVSGHNGFFGAEGPSDLWIVPPYATAKDTLVGRIRTRSGYEPVATDVVQETDSTLLVTSEDELYRVAMKSALADSVVRFTGFNVTNALASDNAGTFYTADTNGSVVSFVLYPTPQSVWGITLPNGYVSSGDIVVSADKKALYIVINNDGPDFMGKIDLATKSLSVCQDPIGFAHVWGLKFAKDALLYGVTADDSNSSLIKFDPANCTGTLVRRISFEAFGAGRTTR
jgi:hypothetical protein